MQDLALALALAAYNAAALIPENGQLGGLPGVAYALVVLQALPLAWRRRWPVAVLFAVGIPSQLSNVLGIPYKPLPLGPMIAFYTVMDRSSTRVRWAISALVLFGVIDAQTTPAGPAGAQRVEQVASLPRSGRVVPEINEDAVREIILPISAKEP